MDAASGSSRIVRSKEHRIDMRRIVPISGRLFTGKSRLGMRLRDEFEYQLVDTSDPLRAEAKRRRIADDQISLQSLGDTLDQETSGRWLADQVTIFSQSLPGAQR